ncbi:MAG: hypothetical protein VKS61_13555 [Candidatus Sericytochromatia bacterium]|nr:hypothetical protein [Candidatus Sericytochromatia bacterium]
MALTAWLAVALVACTSPRRASLRVTSAPALALLTQAVHLRGSAALAGEPFGGAAVRAFDLASGRALGAELWGTVTTDAQGRFELDVPAGAMPPWVKLVATRADRALTTVVDLRPARAPDPGSPPPAPVAPSTYGLRQQGAVVVLDVWLDLPSTVASQALEGSLKVRLRVADAPGSRDALVEALSRAARAVRTALEATPAITTRLASAIGSDGQVRDLGAFRQALDDLRVAETLQAAVHGVLQEATSRPGDPAAPPVTLTAEDFPAGGVTLTGSTYSFVTQDGATVQGSVDLAPPAPPMATPTTGAEAATPDPAAIADPGTRRRRRANEASASPTPTPVPVPTAALDLALGGRFTLTRVAGSASGGNDAGTSATTAALRAVSGVAVTPDGTLFLADPVNHQIRRSVAGGPAERVTGAASGTPGFLDNVTAAVGWLRAPAGLLWDDARGVLLVCDAGNHRVRFLRPGGTIGTLVGGGATTTSPTTASALQLEDPVALVANQSGTLYVADRAAGRVWRIAPNRTATLVASVPGACALALDRGRDLLWVGTTGGEVLRVTTAGGTPGLDTATAVFSRAGEGVLGLAADQEGTLFALAATAGGDARLWRVPTDSQGRLEAGQAATPVGGTGVAGGSGADHAAPTTALADALQARLSVRHPGSLCLDLSAAAAPATPSGQLFVGASFDGDVTWGQVLRLDPVL